MTPYYVARVADLEVGQSDPDEVVRLDQILRERTRQLAKATLPGDVCVQALALMDATEDPERLADMILPTLDCTAAEQAVCAEQLDLMQLQRRVLELVERELAAALVPRGEPAGTA